MAGDDDVIDPRVEQLPDVSFDLINKVLLENYDFLDLLINY